jgi:hypothetical protein
MYMEEVRPGPVERLAWAMYKCRGRQDAGSGQRGNLIV